MQPSNSLSERDFQEILNLYENAIQGDFFLPLPFGENEINKYQTAPIKEKVNDFFIEMKIPFDRTVKSQRYDFAAKEMEVIEARFNSGIYFLPEKVSTEAGEQRSYPIQEIGHSTERRTPNKTLIKHLKLRLPSAIENDKNDIDKTTNTGKGYACIQVSSQTVFAHLIGSIKFWFFLKVFLGNKNTELKPEQLVSSKVVHITSLPIPTINKEKKYQVPKELLELEKLIEERVRPYYPNFRKFSFLAYRENSDFPPETIPPFRHLERFDIKDIRDDYAKNGYKKSVLKTWFEVYKEKINGGKWSYHNEGYNLKELEEDLLTEEFKQEKFDYDLSIYVPDTPKPNFKFLTTYGVFYDYIQAVKWLSEQINGESQESNFTDSIIEFDIYEIYKKVEQIFSKHKQLYYNYLKTEIEKIDDPQVREINLATFENDEAAFIRLIIENMKNDLRNFIHFKDLATKGVIFKVKEKIVNLEKEEEKEEEKLLDPLHHPSIESAIEILPNGNEKWGKIEKGNSYEFRYLHGQLSRNVQIDFWKWYLSEHNEQAKPPVTDIQADVESDETAGQPEGSQYPLSSLSYRQLALWGFYRQEAKEMERLDKNTAFAFAKKYQKGGQSFYQQYWLTVPNTFKNKTLNNVKDHRAILPLLEKDSPIAYDNAYKNLHRIESK